MLTALRTSVIWAILRQLDVINTSQIQKLSINFALNWLLQKNFTGKQKFYKSDLSRQNRLRRHLWKYPREVVDTREVFSIFGNLNWNIWFFIKIEICVKILWNFLNFPETLKLQYETFQEEFYCRCQEWTRQHSGLDLCRIMVTVSLSTDFSSFNVYSTLTPYRDFFNWNLLYLRILL